MVQRKSLTNLERITAATACLSEKLPILADLLKQLTGFHDLINIHTGADDGKASLFLTYYTSSVLNPYKTAVLLHHTIACCIFHTFSESRAEIKLHLCPVFLINRILHHSVDSLIEILIAVIAQKMNHLLIGKVEWKAFLAKPSNHTSRKRFCIQLCGMLLVSFGQLPR